MYDYMFYYTRTYDKTRNVKGNKRIGLTQCVFEKMAWNLDSPYVLGIFKEEMSWKNILLKSKTNQFN